MVTQVMGILNLTPDSFFADSRMTEADSIRKRAFQIVDEGAKMIDIGACSTRPGAQLASEEEEIERLKFGMPLIEEICHTVPLSIDTFRASVAELCLSTWRVKVINDVSGGEDEMFNVVAKYDAEYVLTYNHPSEEDMISDMLSFFQNKISRLKSFGVNKIILDPGFGFSKTIEQNYLVMNNLSQLKSFGLPVLVGISRKSMIFKLLNITPNDSLNGTTVLNTIAAQADADWLRVHDVRQAVETVKIVNALNNNK